MLSELFYVNVYAFHDFLSFLFSRNCTVYIIIFSLLIIGTQSSQFLGYVGLNDCCDYTARHFLIPSRPIPCRFQHGAFSLFMYQNNLKPKLAQGRLEKPCMTFSCLKVQLSYINMRQTSWQLKVLDQCCQHWKIFPKCSENLSTLGRIHEKARVRFSL